MTRMTKDAGVFASFRCRIFSDILGAMDDDWNNCAADSYVRVMTSKAILAHRCSNVMMTVNALSAIFYFIGSHISHRAIAADGEHREFPMQVQFPFNATNSPIFEFVVLGLFLHVLETATVIAILNSLILTLVSRGKHLSAVNNGLHRIKLDTLFMLN